VKRSANCLRTVSSKVLHLTMMMLIIF